MAVAISCGFRRTDSLIAGRRHRDGELVVACGALRDGLGELLRKLLGGHLQGVESPPKLLELPAFATEEQVSKLGELADAHVAVAVAARRVRRAVRSHRQPRAFPFAGWRVSPPSRVAMSTRLGITLEQAVERHAADYALKRVSKDADVANACLFLASDASRQITGIDLPVDGGWAML